MGTLIVCLVVAGSLLLLGIGYLLVRNLRRRSPQLSSVTRVAPVTAPSPSGGLTERRQSTRRWGDPVQVLIWDHMASAEPTRGWIMNRCAEGLGLSAAQPFAEGNILSVRIANVADTVPWVRVEVRSAQLQAGRWLLGCRFVETPAKEVLLMFR